MQLANTKCWDTYSNWGREVKQVNVSWNSWEHQLGMETHFQAKSEAVSMVCSRHLAGHLPLAEVCCIRLASYTAAPTSWKTICHRVDTQTLW